ncbi:MAG: ketopantoate reductase family protein [Dokdonella sp.]
MRVLVLGAGGIGGYFGARLIERGHEVTFLVRPARAAILARNGLRVHSARGDFSRPVDAAMVVGPHVPYELVLVSCKAYDLDSAISSISPAVTAETRVLPLLNGLRHLDGLDAAFGASHVIGGLCHISVTLEDDGAIRQFGALERLTFGTRDTAPVPAAIRSGLLGLGEHVVESPTIMTTMWEKFAFIATLAGMTCVMRGSVGEIVATPEGADLARAFYAECSEIARRSGHALSAEAMVDAARILTTSGSPLKASMLRDLERGACTECEHILGDLRARACGHAFDTPLPAGALTHLRVYENARLTVGVSG